MEHVAENTAAETEVKEVAAEKEKYITIPEAEFQAMLLAAAKTAIKELRTEEAKEKKKSKYHDTFSLMKCYRDATFHIENAISEGTQLELEGMTEEQQEKDAIALIVSIQSVVNFKRKDNKNAED